MGTCGSSRLARCFPGWTPSRRASSLSRWAKRSGNEKLLTKASSRHADGGRDYCLSIRLLPLRAESSRTPGIGGSSTASFEAVQIYIGYCEDIEHPTCGTASVRRL